MSGHADIIRLIAGCGLVSDQVNERELAVILRELDTVLRAGTHGAVVEFGCYVGTTSLYLRRLMDIHEETREFHVYDSFAGLPEKTREDHSPAGEWFKPGELYAAKKHFILNFKKAGLRLPHIHKGWFCDIESAAVPGEIAFAFLDGDYYDSIKASLKLIWPRVTRGAVIVVDDYANDALPGARRAVDEWITFHPAEMRATHSLAVITAA